MKTLSSHQPPFTLMMVALAVGLALCGCHRRSGESKKPSAIQRLGADPLAIALAPHSGNAPLDSRIRCSQDRVRASQSPEMAIEELGWLFVAKARESFDAGFYKLAEQCALGLELRQPGSPEGLLLRGHALHSQHRFREAEQLAEALVAKRGFAFDYGLLGDILVDFGRVDEAAHAYQTMLDLKPDPQGYARAAHIRWLKGDLSGAVEAMRMATGAGAARDSESAAWMHTQLARYLWQTGRDAEADRALGIALVAQTNFAPALLLRGRTLLAAAKEDDALHVLTQAAQLNPLPEYQWALSEALRATDRNDEARAIESEILSRGPASDPRTCALFFATRRTHLDLAERLARQEISERQDVFTHDALAWALAAQGNFEEAAAEVRMALAQGTQDARIYFHAAIIAARIGKMDEAVQWSSKALVFQSQLLPGESAQLHAVERQLASRGKPLQFSERGVHAASPTEGSE